MVNAFPPTPGNVLTAYGWSNMDPEAAVASYGLQHVYGVVLPDGSLYANPAADPTAPQMGTLASRPDVDHLGRVVAPGATLGVPVAPEPTVAEPTVAEPTVGLNLAPLLLLGAAYFLRGRL